MVKIFRFWTTVYEITPLGDRVPPEPFEETSACIS